MKLKSLIAPLFLILALTTAGVCAGDVCLDRAEPALSALKTWKDLHLWYKNYPQCDDGYFGEGLSDFVVVSLAKRWGTLPLFQAEIKRDKTFEHFVLKHIDATTDKNDLKVVIENSKTKCPSNLQAVCKRIEKEARMALKEIKE